MFEKENTLRTLKDEPQLATGLFCCVGLHKWTKYGEPHTRKEGIYQVDYQSRHCANCHKLDLLQLRKF